MQMTSADYFMPKEYLDEILEQTMQRDSHARYIERELERKDLIFKHDPLMPSFIIEMWVNKAY